MSIVSLILGKSGTGKSASLRNLDPAHTLLIQTIRKPLPFKNPAWKSVKEGGNIFISDDSAQICHAMQKTSRDIIVLDDFIYVLSNEFMRRVLDQKTGNASFAQYNEIAKNAWDILNCASSLPDHKRVYIMSHSSTDENGQSKIKLIGKLLEDKITVEGMVSIVLYTAFVNENYLFSTRNSGSNTCKTPMGLFDEELIPNDLFSVDSAIVAYYGLGSPETK